MAETLFGFNRSDANKILAMIGEAGTGLPRELSNIPDEGPRLALAYTENGVTGRGGTTPGTGTATLKRITDGAITNLDPSSDITVYNLATASVAGAKYLMLVREYFSGKWFVVWEECE